MVSEALERLRQMREAPGEPLLSSDPQPSLVKADPTKRVPVEWDECSRDVLDLLAKAGTPLLHTALTQALAGRGYDIVTARKGIAACQRHGWIEHNLVSGYVLSGSERQRQLTFDGAA